MRFYKLIKWKVYFDNGYGMTSYVKYLIAFVGGAEILINQSYKLALMIGVIYGISCFFLGWVWLTKGFKEAETEVYNRVDPFVKEMREINQNKLLGTQDNRKVFKE